MAIHGLQPSCLAINADMALRRGQMMSIDEAVAYHEPQLRAAARLGFPIVRCQFAAPPEVLRRLVPLAEKLEIKMGPEIHAPMSVSSPPVLAYREMYAKVNSPSLGFIPDFGSSAREVPASYLAYLSKQGMPAELIKLAVEIWHSPQDARQKREEFTEKAGQRNADPTVISGLAVIFNILSRQEAKAWLDIMPQVIHVHGKCYDFAPDGTETSIPYDELLPVFVRSGYNGFMSTEWEGHLYSQADAFDMVEKHHALCRRILKMPAAEAAASQSRTATATGSTQRPS
jgi:sugar phosphate isomerase/epimerase